MLCDPLQAEVTPCRPRCRACLESGGKVAEADLSCLQILLKGGQRGLTHQGADVSSGVPKFCHS